MATWGEVDARGGMELLPAGIRNYEVVDASARINEHTGRREALITVSSVAGAGEFTIPLESWGDDDLFEFVFQKNAAGMGFVPPSQDAQVSALVPAFVAFLPSTRNNVVELDVKHKDSAKLKDDGTPFVNHQVKVKRVVQGGVPAPVAVAATGGVAPAQIDEIPFDFR